MLAARHRARLAMADKNPDSQEAKLKSVRRRINFGDSSDDNLPSREELERKFAEERSRHLEEKKAKWNFDFNAERPLEGQWEWEPVEKNPSDNSHSQMNGESQHARNGESHQPINGENHQPTNGNSQQPTNGESNRVRNGESHNCASNDEGSAPASAADASAGRKDGDAGDQAQ